MGSVGSERSELYLNMKFLVVASALVGAFSASAAPQLLAGGLGYAGYAGYPYALGYGLGVKSAPCVNAANFPVPCAGKRKRDADADPALLYGGYAGSPYAHAAYGYAGVPFASSTGLDALTQGLDASTQGVAPYAAYAGHGLGYYGKRDAEADPALLYGGYAGYPYAHAAYGYAAGVPFASSTGLDALTQGLGASTQGVAPYAAYAGYGLGYYGKRDADAAPALLYGGYAGYGAYGVTHPSNLGLCLNYVGAQVPC